MLEYLKKVGVGKERSKDLTYQEAYQANKKILNKEATDIQIGSFWGAMRMKYATEEELIGFIDSIKEELEHIELDEIVPVDLGINYDGKNRSLHILPASIFIATGAGAKVVGHGNENVPSKFGITYHQVLEAMGCGILSDKESIIKSLELSGFSFYHQRFMCPKLAGLLPKRREFGLRTYLNTVEKILNPFKTTKALIGVAHKPYINKYIKFAHHTGFKNIFVVKGLEGGIEPFFDKETKVFTNKIFSISIVSKSNGYEPPKPVSVKENAELCISILKNKETYLNNWALITAGLIIVAYGITEDIKKATELAEESLKSGAAYESFQVYRSLTSM
jgi:anthranilate phosphoribosyltransferase